MTKAPTTHIPYEEIVQHALRAVARDVLKQVEREGFPGSHHLYITFQTGFPGVEMADYLKERHPQEVTIVLQHQFWDLSTTEKSFSVTLSFNDVKERLVIPYNAITGFVDPSVKFGLHFTPLEIEEEETPVTSKPQSSKKAKKTKESHEKESSPVEGKVITLDAFRKKK